jgi:uncharacterized glyoxalase superfamily protein PhnB
MTETTTTSNPTVWPTLRYRDAPAAIRFLVDGLGFTEVAVYPGEHDGQIAHAQLRWPGGGGLMLGSYREDGPLADFQPGVGSVYLVTDDVDGVVARAAAAGGKVVLEPAEQDYGGRGGTVRDPEGVFFSVGSYRGE